MCVSTYCFLILIGLKREGLKGSVRVSLRAKLGKIRKDSKYADLFIRTYNFCLPRIISIFRYFPIIAAINAALHSINILNTVLFCMALLLLWNPSFDKKYWIHFLVYIFFIIIIKQVSNQAFPIQKFNVELIAMIGITTIEQQAMHS